MNNLVWVAVVAFVVAAGACSNKNSNNDINEAETVTGRSAPANWTRVEAKWTRVDPWDGSCPEVQFESDSDGHFKTQGCDGEVVGQLTGFEINRLNEAANELIPTLTNSAVCDLQKTPDLKVEQKLTTPDEDTRKFLYTEKGGKTCRGGEFPQVTTLAKVLLELQLKYEEGLPRPEPTPTPVPTPTPLPIPLPSEPLPLPTATPRPTAPPIPWPF